MKVFHYFTIYLEGGYTRIQFPSKILRYFRATVCGTGNYIMQFPRLRMAVQGITGISILNTTNIGRSLNIGLNKFEGGYLYH